MNTYDPYECAGYMADSLMKSGWSFTGNENVCTAYHPLYGRYEASEFIEVVESAVLIVEASREMARLVKLGWDFRHNGTVYTSEHPEYGRCEAKEFIEIVVVTARAVRER